jgi:hypothetical protein
MSTQIQSLLQTLIQSDVSPSTVEPSGEVTATVNYMGQSKGFPVNSLMDWADAGKTFGSVLNDVYGSRVNASRVNGVRLTIDGQTYPETITMNSTLPQALKEAKRSISIAFAVTSGRNG